MIFHLVLNSLFVFCVLIALIECTLLFLNVRSPRIRYMCRLLPLLKLPFDIILFETYGESLFVNFNPFSCEIYLHQFITNLFPTYFDPSVGIGHHVIIPEYISSLIPSFWFTLLISGIAVFSIVAMGRKFLLFIYFRKYLKNILNNSQLCERPILNPQLKKQLNRLKAVILTSPLVQIPFAANLRYILVPSDLSNELSQEEFEAVIVHEFEHLRWKDPILKMFSGLICALFWWLPSSWWLKRMEEEQEQACDAEVYKYGIDGHVLAAVMIKVIKRAQYLKCQYSTICPFDSPKTNHRKRLESLLNFGSERISYTKCFAGLILCSLICFCFWMC